MAVVNEAIIHVTVQQLALINTATNNLRMFGESNEMVFQAA